MDVDGVYTRNTIVNPDFVISQGEPIHPFLSFLSFLRVEELDESPVLNAAVSHRDLAVWRVFHHGEYLPVGGHVSIVGREFVHIQTLGVELSECDMCRVEPVCLYTEPFQLPSIQEMSGLSCSLITTIFDQSVTLAVPCLLTDHEEGCPHLTIGSHHTLE